MQTTETPGAADSTDDDNGVDISRLQAELNPSTTDNSGTAVTDTVEEVEANLFDGSRFEFADGQVKSSLDELLLSIVALRSSDTHGKQLLDDLGGEFDTMLSPGTVYPRLHGLCDEGVLQRRELVSTKEYTLDDTEAARARIAEAAKQHLALGMVLHAALEDGEFN
jgi:DNA-binding PadR family transcriptional regulator